MKKKVDGVEERAHVSNNNKLSKNVSAIPVVRACVHTRASADEGL